MRGARDIIKVRRATTGAHSVDNEGMWSPDFVDTEVQGSFHDTLGRFGQRLEGVVRLPLETLVSDVDQIVIDDILDQFDGVYQIENIQYTITHLRVQIRRTLING